MDKVHVIYGSTTGMTETAAARISALGGGAQGRAVRWA